MANRHMLNPRLHIIFPCNNQALNRFRKALFFTFALVSYSVTINCASFDRSYSDDQQWQEPKYQLMPDQKDVANLYELQGQQSSGSSLGDASDIGYFVDEAVESNDQSRSPNYYVAPPHSNLNPDLFGQLVLSQHKDDDDQSLTHSQDYYVDRERELDAKLLDLLDKKLSLLTDDNNAVSTKQSESKSSLSSSLDQNEELKGIHLDDKHEDSLQKDDHKQHQNEIYHLGDEEKTTIKDFGKRNFTTLIEDELNNKTSEFDDTKPAPQNPDDKTTIPSSKVIAAETKPHKSFWRSIVDSLAQYLPLSDKTNNSSAVDHPITNSQTNDKSSKNLVLSEDETDLKSKLSDHPEAKNNQKTDSKSRGGDTVDEGVRGDDNTFDSDKRVGQPSSKADAERQGLDAVDGKEDEFFGKSISVHLPMSKMVEVVHPNEEHSGHKINLMRQSNLVVPLKFNDDTELTPESSLLGKYIYAPEHHYHINGVDLDKAKALDDDQVYAKMVHRSYSRRLQPDDEMYGTFSGFGPKYSSQRGDPLSKSNDMYFLVMVGAFCAMAMAVVLAAGLFAYRVQQNRKSSLDADYPTYGVVGPNNINAKCNPASFVGGYFTGPVSGTGSSPSSSIKHSQDVYGAGDLAPGAVKPGKNHKVSAEQMAGSNNRSNYNANQNVARMYHYQHQKQQMIISDRASTGRHTSASDLDSEEEAEEGSYTVYECPGLASAHEMEIKNPLFNDDRTP